MAFDTDRSTEGTESREDSGDIIARALDDRIAPPAEPSAQGTEQGTGQGTMIVVHDLSEGDVPEGARAYVARAFPPAALAVSYPHTFGVCRKDGTERIGQPGDYLVIEPGEERRVIDRDVFELLYVTDTPIKLIPRTPKP